MSDWSGGYQGSRPAGARIPVKVHRNVSLIRTMDETVSAELLARPRVAKWIVGQLSPQVLLVHSGKVQDVLDELKRMGHTPQVVAPS